MISIVEIGKWGGNTTNGSKFFQNGSQRIHWFLLNLISRQKFYNSILKFKCKWSWMSLLQSSRKIGSWKMITAGFRNQLHTDPIMLSIFHTQSTTIFKINTLPGNDAAQGSSYSGTGTGQNRILLNSLSQKFGKENCQCPVRGPEWTRSFKNSQTS